MAVTQISRIQHRRGLEQDLPQLASAELGWSIDTRQLYIGNGTLEEGAPIVGVTRILTENDIAAITEDVRFTTYTFVGNTAGYVAQTGPSELAPVVRTYQEKLDDIVNVKDFGATGDGVTDDTAAINRALQQIYNASVTTSDARTRRTIYFPGGTYQTSDTILIPTYAKIVGDGKSSAIIRQQNGNRTVANICDSKFQNGSSLGTNSAELPKDIEISGLQFLNANTSITQPIFIINSASNVRISSTNFVANSAAGFYPNLISILGTSATTTKVTIECCQFTGGGNGIAIIDTSASSIRLFNSGFNNLSNVAAHLGTSQGFTSIGNYFNTTQPILSNGNNLNLSLNDYGTSLLQAGIFVGNFQYSPTQTLTVTSANPLVLGTLANTTIYLKYELRSVANARVGEFNYTINNNGIVYDDSYVETSGSVNGNISANNDSILVSVSSGTATFKYNFSRFI